MCCVLVSSGGCSAPLQYAMNEKTKFRVQTPVGVSDEAVRGEGLAQGSLEGALVSSVNLDSGVRDYFKKSKNEVCYLSLQLGPLLYQDDISRLASSVEDAQSGNNRLEMIAETKLLDYNLSKSGFLVVGKKKAVQNLQIKLKESPLMFCGEEMSQEKSIKYLGDHISAEGLAESVKVTVNKRFGLANRAISDIRAVIDDCRSHVCGGIVTGLTIWESAVLPGLLYNAECWINISNGVLQQLEQLQLRFYRSLLAVGSGCPIPMLYWDTGGLQMKYCVLKKKLLFLHHLATLPDDSLAKECFELQRQQRLPGLYLECEDTLKKNGLLNLSDFTKFQWKNRVRKLCHKLNQEELLDKMKSYKKLT